MLARRTPAGARQAPAPEKRPPALNARVIAPRRGWRGPAAGRAAHVETGSVYLGTSVQVAGLFPFMQASGLPAEGVPIGPDLLTHEMVCLDPPGWLGRLTNNPSIWVQGQPGVGKSAIAKRLCLGLVGYGYAMLCPGDVKGEYAALVRALGGQVVRIGRGLDRINPLDSGPLGRLLPTLPEQRREILLAEVNGRRGELLHALLATAHGLGRRPAAQESAALNAAIRLAAADPGADPTIPDVINVLREAPGPLLDRLMLRSHDEYLTEVRAIVAALENLCDGPLSGLFDGPTTTPLDLNAPAVSVDLSAILTAGDHVVAAGLLACWAYSYSAVDTARAFGVLARPVVLPLDELWRALRAGPGMVEAFDGITRLNRAKGEISLMITHSLRDLEALPTEEDRAKASGLMERCDTLILAAMPMSELTRISQRKPLTDAERELVASWASPTATGIDGTTQVHPGRGKYLIKIGQRIGVPVRLALTPTELELYHTDPAPRRQVSVS
ncbi:ATP-binding protein [Carbonactinospora thermoautotrophica]|nr:ATP-binding protein [Carbonactinospora thermoautotrophica]